MIYLKAQRWYHRQVEKEQLNFIRIQKTLALDYSSNINDIVCEIKILNFSQDLIQFIDFGFMRLESKTFLEDPSLSNPISPHDTGEGGLPLTQSDSATYSTYIISINLHGSITIPTFNFWLSELFQSQTGKGTEQGLTAPSNTKPQVFFIAPCCHPLGQKLGIKLYRN